MGAMRRKRPLTHHYAGNVSTLFTLKLGAEDHADSREGLLMKLRAAYAD